MSHQPDTMASQDVIGDGSCCSVYSNSESRYVGAVTNMLLSESLHVYRLTLCTVCIPGLYHTYIHYKM